MKRSRVVPNSYRVKRKKGFLSNLFSKENLKSWFFSFRTFLSASFFVLLTLAVFIESIPFIVSTITNSFEETQSVSEFHFSTIESFFSEKFGAIQTSARILVDDWNHQRLAFPSLISNETSHSSSIWKLFSHLKNFDNTFCSFIFGDYRGHYSSYVGFDYVDCDGSRCYRFWLQTDTDLTVYDTWIDQTLDYPPYHTVNLTDINRNLPNFNSSTRSYFYSAIDKPDGIFGSPYASAAGHINLYFSLPFKTETGHSGSDDDYVGIVKNNLSLQMVTSYLTSIIKDGLVVIVEKDGKIIGSSDVNAIPFQVSDEKTVNWYLAVSADKRVKIQDITANEGIKQAMTFIDFTSSNVQERSTFYGASYILSVSPFVHDGLEWNILYFRATWDVYSDLIISLIIIVFLSTILSVLCSILGYLLITMFVNFPINKLMQQMSEVEDFKFDEILERPKRKLVLYEIEKLQMKFLFFAKALKKLISFLPSYIKSEKKYNADGKTIISSDDGSESRPFINGMYNKKSRRSNSSGVRSDTSSTGTVDDDFQSSVKSFQLDRGDDLRPVAIVHIAIKPLRKNNDGRYCELLECVERVVEDCRGSILTFGKRSIVLGFNCLSIQNMQDGYQLMAARFCLTIRDWYMKGGDLYVNSQKKKPPPPKRFIVDSEGSESMEMQSGKKKFTSAIGEWFELHFAITVESEVEVRIIGTSSNKVREVSGDMTARAKIISDVILEDYRVDSLNKVIPLSSSQENQSDSDINEITKEIINDTIAKTNQSQSELLFKEVEKKKVTRPIIIIEYEASRSFPPNYLFKPYKFTVMPLLNDEKFRPLVQLIEENRDFDMQENNTEWTYEIDENSESKESPNENENENPQAKYSKQYEELKGIMNGEIDMKKYSGSNDVLRRLCSVYKQYNVNSFDEFVKKLYAKLDVEDMKYSGFGGKKKMAKKNYLYCVDIVEFMRKEEKNLLEVMEKD